MRELEIKRGWLSEVFLKLFLIFNFLMMLGFGLIVADGNSWFGLAMLSQTIWMPGAVILGMLTIVTNKQRIVLKEPTT
jgi:hypothetical protein